MCEFDGYCCVLFLIILCRIFVILGINRQLMTFTNYCFNVREWLQRLLKDGLKPRQDRDFF